MTEDMERLRLALQALWAEIVRVFKLEEIVAWLNDKVERLGWK
jgi:hypothetical protein